MAWGTAAICAEQGKCKLPEADFRQGASPPNLNGTIAKLRDGCFRLTSSRNADTRSKVCLTPRTIMFTVYGGHVAPGELQDGQRVHVWLEGCRPPTGSLPSEAAVIEVASLTPGEDFP